MKKFTKILKNQKGLTLIELLAVIVILAIVAAIAVPSIGNIINNSKDKAILADASVILSGAKLAMLDGSCKTGADTDGNTCTNTELSGYVEGITLGTNDKVVKSGNIYTVTYAKLGTIQNATKFDVTAVANSHAAFDGGTSTSTSIDEKALNIVLNN